ncbi:MAG: sporulation transcriptional regulator SpoIIID [Oscillospiraceae bacterium]|nr:sporulation transcriptional regulator SpoIIID [Oscillospiraceae bacterium]
MDYHRYGEGTHLKGLPEERAITFAHYIIEHHTTVRATAKEFHISKSTVHKDITERLKKMNPLLYNQVKEVLDKNKSERHIRGGIATREKYARMKKNAKA